MNRRGFLAGASFAALIAHGRAFASVPLTGAGSAGASGPVALPVAGVAPTTSYNFTPDNALIVANQAGLGFPANAMKCPATAANGWFAILFFTIPQTFNYLALNEIIAHAGTGLITSATGGAVWIGESNNASPLGLSVYARNGGSNIFASGTTLTATLARGTSYMLMLGQLNASTYALCVLDTKGNVVVNTTVGAGSGNCNNLVLWSGLGLAYGMTSGGAASASQLDGFSGSVGPVAMLWGSAGFSAPSTATLQALAAGATSIAAFAASISATVQYSNACSLDNGLAANAGTVTGAMTALTGTFAGWAALKGDPIQQPAYLTIQNEGDNYVWGTPAGASTGKVWVRGTYAVSNGLAPSVEMRLVRDDNGADLVAWTLLSGAAVSGGAYSGYLVAPAGIGFRRQVRFAGNAATVVAAGEKHAVGDVILVNAQSQSTMLFDAGPSGSGSSLTLTPTNASNLFSSCLRMPNDIADTPAGAPTMGPVADYYACRPLLASSTNGASTQYPCFVGDGMLSFVAAFQTQSGRPLMLVQASHSGSSPMNWYGDRQTISYQPGASTNGWTPNGSTTAFTVTIPTATTSTCAIRLPFMDGKAQTGGTTYPSGYAPSFWLAAGGSGAPVISPGTLQVVAGGVTFTDNGAGALTGSDGVSTGTVAYSAPSANPSFTLTFASGAPAGGVALTATWTYVSDYLSGSNNAKATPNGFSLGGVVSGAYGSAAPQPHTGQIADIYAKLWNNVLTAILHPWWTTWLPFSQYSNSTYAAIYAATFPIADALRHYHRQFAAAQNAKFGFAPAAREAPNSPATGGSPADSTGKYGGHRNAVYAYVAANPSACFLLADCTDTTISSNSGPHEDLPGYLLMGQRYGRSAAVGLGYGGGGLFSGAMAQQAVPAAPVMGPVLRGVARTSSTVLTLTFALPNGTSLSTYGGLANPGGVTAAGTAVYGFEIGQSSVSQAAAFNARATTGFTAALASATTITITLGAGAWLTFVSVNYGANYSVFSGTSNGAADATAIGTLLCDNSGFFTQPAAGAGPPAGNAAQTVLDWAA